MPVPRLTGIFIPSLLIGHNVVLTQKVSTTFIVSIIKCNFRSPTSADNVNIRKRVIFKALNGNKSPKLGVNNHLHNVLPRLEDENNKRKLL